MQAMSDGDVLNHGREVLRAEAEAVMRAAEALDASFSRAVRLVESCTGSVARRRPRHPHRGAHRPARKHARPRR